MPMNESNSPELAHAQKPNKPVGRNTIGWLIIAVVLGVITGALGTVLHLNSYWTGTFGIPWGVVLSLALAGAAQWWIGLRSGTILATGLTGISQYIGLALLVVFNTQDHFTVPLNAQTWEFIPHLVIASLVWQIGIVVLTLVTVVLVNRTIRRASRPIANGQPTPAVDPVK